MKQALVECFVENGVSGSLEVAAALTMPDACARALAKTAEDQQVCDWCMNVCVCVCVCVDLCRKKIGQKYVFSTTI